MIINCDKTRILGIFGWEWVDYREDQGLISPLLFVVFAASEDNHQTTENLDEINEEIDAVPAKIMLWINNILL
jgi:hypothetical protein